LRFSRTELVVAAAVLACGGFLLAPILQIGFVNDDTINSTLNGWLGFEHKSLWFAFQLGVASWIKAQGRFFPVAFAYSDIFWHIFPYERTEKLFQLTAVLINIATFYLLVREISKSRRTALVCIFVVLTTLQIRAFYDGIIGFLMLMPIVLESILLSSYLFVCSLRRNDFRFAIAGAIVSTVGLLTYEVTYGLLFLPMYLAWRFSPRAAVRWRTLILIAAPLAALTLLDITLRATAHVAATSPYGIAAHPREYAVTLMRQLLGAVPLSYVIFHPSPTTPALDVFIGMISPRQWLLGAVAALCAFTALRRIDRSSDSHRAAGTVDLLVYGFGLWIIPAAIIALSPRWQAELQPGLAYIPVYIEYFGIASIAGSAISLWLTYISLNRTASIAAAITFAIAVGFGLAMTASSNAYSLSSLLPVYTYTRLNIERALRAGLFDPLPPGATVVLDGSYLFTYESGLYGANTRDLIYQYSQRRVDVVPPTAIANGSLCVSPFYDGLCHVPPNTYAYQTNIAQEDDAWLQVAHITKLERTASGIVAITDRARVYAAGKQREHLLERSDVRVVQETPGAGIYDITPCAPLVVSALTGVTILFGSGFSGLEEDSAGPFHWGDRKSTLIIDSGTLRPIPVTVHFFAQSLKSNILGISTGRSRKNILVSQNGTSVALNILSSASKPAEIELTAAHTQHVPGDPRSLGVRINAIHAECAAIASR
jgi:hypothetical protein